MANFEKSLEKLMAVSDTLYTKLDEIAKRTKQSDFQGTRMSNSFVNISNKNSDLIENNENSELIGVSKNALLQTI